MKQFIQTIACILLITTTFTACRKDNFIAEQTAQTTSDLDGKLGPNQKTFSVSKFKSALSTNLYYSANTQPYGYSFVINKDGLLADQFSFGTATRGNGVIPWTIDQEIHVASVSKTLTAVAVFQLMKKNNLKTTDSIGAWLPKYFKAIPAVSKLTFGELMTHKSGLINASTSYDTIKAVVKKPLANPSKSYVYANINYALFRIIIPYLTNKPAAVAKENSMQNNTAGFEQWLSATYQTYMQANVFSPIGLGTVNCIPSANTAQMFGEPAGPGQAVANLTTMTESCGGTGFYMSVKEMARFMAYMAHSNVLLDDTQINQMNTQLMGWDNSNSPMTNYGQAYGKNGAWYSDINNSGGLNTGDAGLQTLMMRFPNGVELTMAVNSVPGSWRSLSTVATNAYNAAWQ